MNKARRRLARARRYRDRAYIPQGWTMGGMSPDFPTKTEEQVARFVAEITKRARKNKVLVLTYDSRSVYALRRLLPGNVQVVMICGQWNAPYNQGNSKLALAFRGHVAAFPVTHLKLRA